MMKPTKRREHPDPDWPLFKVACGNKCCVCGKPEAESGELRKGHIHRHAKGGSHNWENRIPICDGCNNKYRKNETPDNRPSDWRERFSLLWLHQLRPKLFGYAADSLCYLVPDGQAQENAKVIVWDAANLGRFQIPFTQSSDVTERVAKTLVRELIDKAKRRAQILPGPNGETQESMVAIALRYGAKDFRRAGEKFLECQPWVGFEGSGVLFHVWQREFVDNFDYYEGWWRREKARREAEARATKRLMEKHEEEIRLQRIADFLCVVPAADWDGWTSEEQEHVAKVMARKDAPGDVTEEEAKTSVSLMSHYNILTKAAADDKPSVLRQHLHEQLEVMPPDWKQTQEYLDLWYGIRRAESFEELRELSHKVIAMLKKRAEEPPDRPSDDYGSF